MKLYAGIRIGGNMIHQFGDDLHGHFGGFGLVGGNAANHWDKGTVDSAGII